MDDGDDQRGGRPTRQREGQVATENGPPAWRSNRERIAYEEGRHVLEAQKADVDDIDDKALRTVRITAVLLGVGATGARVIGVSGLNGGVAALSLLAFFLSLVFGVIVYNESNEVIGPSADYLGTLRRDNVPVDWEVHLLAQFEAWIRSNQDIVEFNGALLVACQSFFVIGVGLGVAALLSLSTGEIVALSVVLILVVVAVLAVIEWRQGE